MRYDYLQYKLKDCEKIIEDLRQKVIDDLRDHVNYDTDLKELIDMRHKKYYLKMEYETSKRNLPIHF